MPLRRIETAKLIMTLVAAAISYSYALGCVKSPQLATLIVPIPKPANLTEIFQEGMEHLSRNQVEAAKACFVKAIELDSNDWEAHEKLVMIYQLQREKENRDRELDALRQMFHLGIAWRGFFWRDEFLHKGMRISTVEVLSPDATGGKKFLFPVSDAESGKFLFLISLVRKEKNISVKPDSPAINQKKIVPGYQVTISDQSRKSVYFLPYEKPKYSEMKRYVEEFLN